MFIRAEDEGAKNWRVFLDGRPVPYALAANDEEGWVEVLDTKFIGMVAPITQSSATLVDSSPEPIELARKRLHGKVSLKRVDPRPNIPG